MNGYVGIRTGCLVEFNSGFCMGLYTHSKEDVMFGNMKLTTKMAAGFGIMIAIIAILGVFCWKGLGKIEHKVETGDDANRLVKFSLEGRQHEKNFMLRKDRQYFDDAKEINTSFRNR
jgi:hypothetical protein